MQTQLGPELLLFISSPSPGRTRKCVDPFLPAFSPAMIGHGAIPIQFCIVNSLPGAFHVIRGC